MTAVFVPNFSFYADLYWQKSSTDSEHLRVSRAGTPFGHEDGWIWAADPALLNEGNMFLDHQDFWFGCFEEDGQYAYEIRGRTPGSFPLKATCRLDVSRNGYLGMYPIPGLLDLIKPGAVLTDLFNHGYPIPVWTMPSVDPAQLSEGMTVWDIQLVSPQGKQARRLLEDGFYYLNHNTGEPVAFGLTVKKFDHKGFA